MNEYYFHTLDVREAFRADAEEIFSNEQIYEELGCEVYVLAGSNKKSTSFPCIYTEITNAPTASEHSSNTEIQRFTDFTLTFDIYSKDLEAYNQDDAVVRLSEILVQNLQKKYHSLTVTLNQPLPNMDQTVSRWQVRFRGTFDNGNNFIYSD